jgi:hypothetical protein
MPRTYFDHAGQSTRYSQHGSQPVSPTAPSSSIPFVIRSRTQRVGRRPPDRVSLQPCLRKSPQAVIYPVMRCEGMPNWLGFLGDAVCLKRDLGLVIDRVQFLLWAWAKSVKWRGRRIICCLIILSAAIVLRFLTTPALATAVCTLAGWTVQPGMGLGELMILKLGST